MIHSASIHVPVMPEEVLDWLSPQPGQTVVDATFGGGGHARLLAERVGPEGIVIGLDRDPQAIAAGEERFTGLPIRFAVADYCELPRVLAQLAIERVDGVVMDLGMSSDQLADSDRGFSFDAEGPLDLRYDPRQGEPAWRWLERLTAERLADILFRFGEERFSRRIARRIVDARQRSPIRTARQLAEIVRSAVPVRGRSRIDPATRTFQALRIAVNDELKSLEVALQRIPGCLRLGGRMAVISFHSLEDRCVKQAFRDDPRLRPLTKKPIRASAAEQERNPRSRSAKLRAAERV